MQLPFELDALANAHQYQKWIYESVQPYLGKRILELGSGIGNLSQWLPDNELLVLSEVDEELIAVLKAKPEILKKKNVEIIRLDLEKNLNDQVDHFQIDTIVSFNVMEHILNDTNAIRDHVEALRKSKTTHPKKLVIFVPAHNFAYGSFDKVFKHHRRYNVSMMKKIFKEIDPMLKPHMKYFNFLSLPAWIVQGRVFGRTEIKDSQIRVLEKIIPFWKPIDSLINQTLKLPLGQSLVCVVEIQ